MAADDVVAVFVKQNGTGQIWECALIGPPTRYRWPSGALLTARQAHLTQAGVPWKDMGRTDHVEEYGVPVTEPPPPAAYLTAVQVWAGKVDDADPKHGPMDAGTTLATMAWRVLALQAQVAALDEAVWAGTVQVADKLHGPMPATVGGKDPRTPANGSAPCCAADLPRRAGPIVSAAVPHP